MGLYRVDESKLSRNINTLEFWGTRVKKPIVFERAKLASKLRKYLRKFKFYSGNKNELISESMFA